MIVFDFDNTLFNTTLLKEDLKNFFLEFGLSEKKFWSTFYGAYNINPQTPGCYSIEKHLSILSDFSNKEKNEIKKKLEELILQCGQTYLYFDVVSSLKKLKIMGRKLILLTKGDKDFQRLKIKASGIADYFETIYPVDDFKKIDVLKKIIGDEQLIYLDDDIRQINSVKEKFPNSVCFLMLRNKKKYLTNKNIQLVFNLDDFVNHLRSLK